MIAPSAIVSKLLEILLSSNNVLTFLHVYRDNENYVVYFKYLFSKVTIRISLLEINLGDHIHVVFFHQNKYVKDDFLILIPQNIIRKPMIF